MLHAAYLDINPEISSAGDSLVRKLAEGLYARGGRVSIGTPEPTHHINIHHSVDPLGQVLWTCRRWNQALGYASHAAVGKHIAEFIEHGSYEMLKNHVWPELARSGKIDQIPIIMMTSTGQCLRGTLKTEMLRDEKGGFLRTFAKIKLRVPAVLARIAAAGSMALAVAS